MLHISGKIREILTSDDKTIQRNHLTSVYLDYIKMIETKEEANKEAPTEDVKNNVTKIYNEVTSGSMFSSLTNGIRGIFGRKRDAATSNAGPSQSFATAPNTASNLWRPIQQPIRRFQPLDFSVPRTYIEAKDRLKSSFPDHSNIGGFLSLVQNIMLRYKVELKEDRGTRSIIRVMLATCKSLSSNDNATPLSYKANQRRIKNIFYDLTLLEL